MSTERGFTLIEIMITVALLAFLALAGVQLTGGWVQKADITEVEGSLTQALGRAKAAALRNHNGVTSEALPVTAVCINSANATLSVYEATSPAALPNCTSSTGTRLWATQYDADVTIKHGADAVSCVCFNNSGLLTQAHANCNACIAEPTFTLATGDEHETVAIF